MVYMIALETSSTRRVRSRGCWCQDPQNDVPAEFPGQGQALEWRLLGWQFQEDLLNFYQQQGRGPPFVVAHGLRHPTPRKLHQLVYTIGMRYELSNIICNKQNYTGKIVI